MKRDARSISQQVVSGFKISAAIIALGAGFLYCLSLVPVHRIEAFVWHLQHGTSIDVGSYRFPVPKKWYVRRFAPDDIFLVDLQNGDGVGVRLNERSIKMNLAVWARLEEQPIGGSKVTGRKELHLGNEEFLCFEKDLGLNKFNLYPIECRSEGGLEVSFIPYFASGANHNAVFYSLLQQTSFKH
jgi:hypothetical protein